MTSGICSVIRREPDWFQNSFLHMILFHFFMVAYLQRMSRWSKTEEICLIFILCCATGAHIPRSRWLFAVTWQMKASELSAFIASHFGKILPVLPVNSNMPFPWKILNRAPHNMTDCRFFWTSYSNFRCSKSFPVLMRRKCNFISPIIPFFSKSNFISRFVHHG